MLQIVLEAPIPDVLNVVLKPRIHRNPMPRFRSKQMREGGLEGVGVGDHVGYFLSMERRRNPPSSSTLTVAMDKQSGPNAGSNPQNICGLPRYSVSKVASAYPDGIETDSAVAFGATAAPIAIWIRFLRVIN